MRGMNETLRGSTERIGHTQTGVKASQITETAVRMATRIIFSYAVHQKLTPGDMENGGICRIQVFP